MAAHPLTEQQLQETRDLVARYGGVTAAAKATGTNRNTLQAQYNLARFWVPKPPKAAVEPPQAEFSVHDRPSAEPIRSVGGNRHGAQQQCPAPPLGPDTPPRRHVFIPDTQIRPGVPTDHIDWIAKDIARRKPDVIVVGGDWWDFPSLNSHAQPGSAPLEGARYQADLDAGNAAFAQFSGILDKEASLSPQWRPRRVFIAGNHEDRADRVAIADPKWMGHVGSNNCQVGDFEWHPFLRVVEIDGIYYSHYFQNSHSKFPLGGTCDNRLNKIGRSFVQGHEQGKRRGDRITASGATWYGIVAGSCYLHQEDYRGRQGQRHWRGILYMHEVQNGEYDLMELSLNYLCRENTGQSLYRYMRTTYPDMDVEHLR